MPTGDSDFIGKLLKPAARATRAYERPVEFGESPILFPTLIFASLVLIVLGATGPLSMLFAHVSPDYGEGWNAYWTAAAMQSPSALYSPAHVLIANNYPPLSFYVNGLVGRWTGDDLVAGRIVALTGVLGVAGLTGWIVFQLSRSATWGVVSSLLILLYAIYPLGQFFALNNPQWLGQAIMLAGVSPLVGSAGKLPNWRSCVLSAACIVIGLLVKQNQFALPIAIPLWLLVRDRKTFAIWCVAAAGLAITACLVLKTIYGSAIFVELLGFRRTYHLHYFLKGLPKLACLIPFAALGAVAMRQRPLDPRWLLIALYAGLGLVLGALERFGAGVGQNAHYDALIGGTILSGALLGSAAAGDAGSFPGRRYRAPLLGLLLVPIAIAAPKILTESRAEAHGAGALEAQWATLISDVRHAHGPVLCEVLAICYWADKPMELDFFAYGQKLQTGADPAPLRDVIDKKTAALLILDRRFEQHSGETRLPQPFPRLMRETYKPVGGTADIEELAPR